VFSHWQVLFVQQQTILCGFARSAHIQKAWDKENLEVQGPIRECVALFVNSLPHIYFPAPVHVQIGALRRIRYDLSALVYFPLLYAYNVLPLSSK